MRDYKDHKKQTSIISTQEMDRIQVSNSQSVRDLQAFWKIIQEKKQTQIGNNISTLIHGQQSYYQHRNINHEKQPNRNVHQRNTVS